jgi:hypothetical protein
MIVSEWSALGTAWTSTYPALPRRVSLFKMSKTCSIIHQGLTTREPRRCGVLPRSRVESASTTSFVPHLLLTKSSTKDKASGSFHTTDAFYARSTHSSPQQASSGRSVPPQQWSVYGARLHRSKPLLQMCSVGPWQHVAAYYTEEDSIFRGLLIEAQRSEHRKNCRPTIPQKTRCRAGWRSLRRGRTARH